MTPSRNSCNPLLKTEGRMTVSAHARTSCAGSGLHSAVRLARATASGCCTPAAYHGISGVTGGAVAGGYGRARCAAGMARRLATQIGSHTVDSRRAAGYPIAALLWAGAIFGFRTISRLRAGIAYRWVGYQTD